MNDPDILKLVKEQEDYLIKMRRYFHMNPELSNKEFETHALGWIRLSVSSFTGRGFEPDRRGT